MRTLSTKRGAYRVVADEDALIAISTSDNGDYYEFAPNATDADIMERINASCDDDDALPVGEWLTDFDKAPRDCPLLLYSGEIYEPAVGTICEDGDEIISSDTQYDHCPLNHIDQYMIIPDFEP